MSKFNTSILKQASKCYIDDTVDLSLYDFQIFYLLFTLSAYGGNGVNDERETNELKEVLLDAVNAIDLSKIYDILKEKYLPFHLYKAESFCSKECERIPMRTGGCVCYSCTNKDYCFVLTRNILCAHKKILNSLPPLIGCLEFNKYRIVKPCINTEAVRKVRDIYRKLRLKSHRYRCINNNVFISTIKNLCNMKNDDCKKIKIFFILYPFLRTMVGVEEKYALSYFLKLKQWRIINKRKLYYLFLWQKRLEKAIIANDTDNFIDDLIEAFI